MTEKIKLVHEKITDGIANSRKGSGIIEDEWENRKVDDAGVNSVSLGSVGSSNLYQMIAACGAKCNEIDLIATRTSRPPSANWNKFIQNAPRCAAARGIRESSYFHKRQSFEGGAVPQCLKKLVKELEQLEDHLPAEPNCSIWLRYDEDTPQYIRALLAAPLPGPTPYSGGVYAFDMYVPNDYPQTNPKVQLLTTGGGRVRFGPNLYACGKVCLSLLGTWEGTFLKKEFFVQNEKLFG